MSGGTAVTELDLLAYADGLLDSDPVRRRLVEAHLARHPAAAQRLRAFAVQNQDIRRHYDAVLAEPVPPALAAVLERGHTGRPRRRLPRIAAALVLVIAGAGAGWLASGLREAPPEEARAFLERAVAGYRQGPQQAGAVPAEPPPLGWLSEQVAVSIEMPDLAALGLQPVDRRRLPSADGDSAVRIEYAGSDGRRLVLVVGTRWQDRVPEIRVREIGGLQVAHWQDGPLQYGLVAEAGLPLAGLAESLTRRQERAIEARPAEPAEIRDAHVLGVGGATLAPEAERPQRAPAGLPAPGIN